MPQASGEPLSSASLEPFETTQKYGGQTIPQNGIHAPHARLRHWLIQTFAHDDGADLRRRAARLADCCRFPEIRVTEAGEPSLTLRCCRDRLCPFCGRRNVAAKSAVLAATIERFDSAKFLTLTLRHRPEPLRAALDRLLTAFRKLRKRPAWKNRVKGGIYVVEVTRNRATARWHAHLHVLVDSGYFPQPLLSHEWLECTGDSSVVDIRLVRSRQEAVRYLAKYVGKGGSVESLTAAEVCEYARAVHGLRTIQGFGSAHGAKVDSPPPADAQGRGRLVSTTHNLAVWAARGSESAIAAQTVLARLGGRWPAALGVRLRAGAGDVPPPAPDEVRRALAVASGLYDRPMWRLTPEAERAEWAAKSAAVEARRRRRRIDDAERDRLYTHPESDHDPPP